MVETSSPNLSVLDPLAVDELEFARPGERLSLFGSHRQRLRLTEKMDSESARTYVQGDPEKAIDWRTSARNDDLIVREKKRPAPITCAILVDTHASMLWPTAVTPLGTGQHAPPTQKSEIAWRFALTRAHQHIRAGDSVFIGDARDLFQAQLIARPCRERRVVEDLYQAFRRQDWQAALALGEVALPEPRSISRPDLLYLVSDFLDPADPDEWAEPLARHGGRLGGFVLHTLSYYERHDDWLSDEFNYFEESSAKQEFRGRTLRQRQFFSSRRQQWSASINELVTRSGAHYVQVDETTAIASLWTDLIHWESQSLMRGT